MSRYFQFLGRHPYLLAALIVVLFLPWAWMSFLLPTWAIATSLALVPLAAFVAIALVVKDVSADEEAAFKAPLRAQYEREGHPYYASARLWDDGVIAPAETRRVLALAISASLNAPVEETAFGVFRM